MSEDLATMYYTRKGARIKKREYYDIFLAARALAEAAMITSKVPAYPELDEYRASYAEMVEQRIADLMEAING